MSTFIFESYGFDHETKELEFIYSYDRERRFRESYVFSQVAASYDNDALERAMRLAFLLVGTSYYKTFPSHHAVIRPFDIDEWQSVFLNRVYQEGLSQFAYENGLTRDDLVTYKASGDQLGAVRYNGDGIISLQSGGKDSLLTAKSLQRHDKKFTSMYVSSSDAYPAIVDKVGAPVAFVRRSIDRDALIKANDDGAKSGHVPITYIITSIAIIQAILTNNNQVLLSIGHEGEEAHHVVGDLEVTHQWSKTWAAEQMMAEYVGRYISQDIHVGSPLRKYSELRIAELFSENVWPEFGHDFSSCNKINYQQGIDNTTLKWCGECPKCANSYLLFSPFIDSDELKSIFNGQDLFTKPLLADTFKGLLGIDNISKPFECIGEIDELRFAYHQRRPGYDSLPFDVPDSQFDYKKEYAQQPWLSDLF
jgi:UDP-N-acetyl-alpha-D-muramoyl-L-alanyl-L-glutamate epimerase